jgi:hypothetical protein
MKLPIRVIVKGKTTLAEKGLGVPDRSLDGSDHTKTGWMNVVAMMSWIQRTALCHNIPTVTGCS